MSIPNKEEELRKAAQKNDDAVYEFLECLRFVKDSPLCVLRDFKERLHK